jgi:hypothetical protein
MKIQVLAIALALPAVLPRAIAAETLLISYTQYWQYMHPMGINPVINDPNFETTWWLPVADFAAEYDGPEFGGSNPGDANNTASVNTGYSQGPFGYADVDNWNGAYTPHLMPLEGGPAVTSMGTFLTRPTNGNRKASYYRTIFDTTQMMLRPVIRCMVDDGAVIFLDGVQIARVNVTLPTPDALPTYTSFSNADPAAPYQTENTLYTIDLSVGGMQASSGPLQAEVIHPISALPAGTHTLAVFVANVSASNADMLMALQMTAEDGGINPAVANVTRNVNGTPVNPADDTFSFDVTVDHLSGVSGTWKSDSTQHPSGVYGTPYRFSGFPVTEPARVHFSDNGDASQTSLLTVPPPPSPLWIGQIALPGQNGPLLCTPATESVWVQAGTEMVLLSNSSGDAHLLQSAPVSIPPLGAEFSAILEVEDNSLVSNFESGDSVEAVLVINDGTSTFEISTLPISIDRNGDGVLTGYDGPNYNLNIAGDELNPGGRPAEATFAEGIALSASLPPGAVSAQFVVRAVNNQTSETFRIKMVRFAPAGSKSDLDRDGSSDPDELAAGTDPLNAGSRFLSTHARVGNNLAISFLTVPNRSYRVISSPDMENWVTENTGSIVGDGSVFTLQVPALSQRKFIAVQAGRGVNPWP